MKTIGIVGSRRRDTKKDYRLCRNLFDSIADSEDKIVSGGYEKGGDRFAEAFAKHDGRTIIIHYPKWKVHGRSAGFKRNSLIAESCDVLIAVVSDDRKGGTEDIIKKVKKMNKPVYML